MRLSNQQLLTAAASIFMSFYLSSVSFAEDTATKQADSTEILERVTYDIKYLASDELGGRQPGTEGIEKAA